jgi:hypothetical protein
MGVWSSLDSAFWSLSAVVLRVIADSVTFVVVVVAAGGLLGVALTVSMNDSVVRALYNMRAFDWRRSLQIGQSGLS